jgi:hypothetical protein
LAVLKVLPSLGSAPLCGLDAHPQAQPAWQLFDQKEQGAVFAREVLIFTQSLENNNIEEVFRVSHVLFLSALRI